MNLLPVEIHVIEKFYMMGKFQKVLFRGRLKKGKPDGFGILFQYGDIYIGTMKNGYKHGYGILKCKAGYKIIGSRGSFKSERGIYIGYFRNDRLFYGKFIEFNKKNIKRISIKNKIYHGPFTVEDKDYRIISNYKNNKLNGNYKYYSKIYGFNFETFIYNNEFSGLCTRTHQDYYEYLYYVNGIITGKSIYHIFHNSTTFILEWSFDKYNYCKRIYRIIKKGNKIYFPEKIMNHSIVPYHYLCPISYEIMIEPIETSIGQIYNFKNLLKWIYKYKKRTDPLTNCKIKEEFKSCPILQYKIFSYISNELFSEKKELFLV